MLETVFNNPWVRAAALLLALGLVLATAYLLSAVLVPLFFAFVVAYMCDPLIDAFEQRKVPRLWAVIVLVVLLVLAAVFLPLLLVPSMIQEAQRLVDLAGAPEERDWLDQALSRLPLDTWAVELGWVPEGKEDFNAREVFAKKIGAWVRENAAAFIEAHSQQLATVGQQAGAQAAEFLTRLGNFLADVLVFFGNIALFAFVAVYLLKDYDIIVEKADGLVPPRYRDRVRRVFRAIDTNLKAFLRGQVMVGIVLGIMYFIGLKLAGTPFALSLGVFGGVANLVPYLGFILTIGPAMILSVLAHGLDWNIVAVLATFTIAQLLEGNVLTPKIVGSQVGLGPVWIILAVMVFGTTLGFPGLLLAVPIAAVLKVLVLEALAYYRGSPWFEGEPKDDQAALDPPSQSPPDG